MGLSPLPGVAGVSRTTPFPDSILLPGAGLQPCHSGMRHHPEPAYGARGQHKATEQVQLPAGALHPGGGLAISVSDREARTCCVVTIPQLQRPTTRCPKHATEGGVAEGWLLPRSRPLSHRDPAGLGTKPGKHRDGHGQSEHGCWYVAQASGSGRLPEQVEGLGMGRGGNGPLSTPAASHTDPADPICPREDRAEGVAK